MIFTKYEKYGAYHWKQYLDGTKYKAHADRVKEWVKEKNVLDVGAGDVVVARQSQAAKVVLGQCATAADRAAETNNRAVRYANGRTRGHSQHARIVCGIAVDLQSAAIQCDNARRSSQRGIIGDDHRTAVDGEAARKTIAREQRDRTGVVLHEITDASDGAGSGEAVRQHAVHDHGEWREAGRDNHVGRLRIDEVIRQGVVKRDAIASDDARIGVLLIHGRESVCVVCPVEECEVPVVPTDTTPR